jgi:putative tricarboxylic transport membrane protein
LILGVILGPRIEGQLRKTLQLSAGDPAGLFSEPIAIVVYIIVAIVLVWPFAYKLIRPKRLATAQTAPGPAAQPESGAAAQPESGAATRPENTEIPQKQENP